MRKIMLDTKEVDTLVPESLPMLIHGEEGFGASLYTICLAAKWFFQGYKVLFLCGYPMAEEEFAKEVGTDYPTVTFYTKDKVKDFMSAVKENTKPDTIHIIKNIELFDMDIIKAITDMKMVIISGDVSKVTYKKKLEEVDFNTEIYFSPLNEIELPILEKYQGFLISDTHRGITLLQS